MSIASATVIIQRGLTARTRSAVCVTSLVLSLAAGCAVCATVTRGGVVSVSGDDVTERRKEGEGAFMEMLLRLAFTSPARGIGPETAWPVRR